MGRRSAHRTLALTAVLGVVIVVAAGIEGSANFTGLRWKIHWNPSGPTLPEIANQTRPTSPKASAAPPAAPTGSGLLEVLIWTAIALALVVAVVLIRRWLARRPPRAAAGLPEVTATMAQPQEVAPDADPDADVPVLRRGVELALELLEVEREPRDAVIKAWLGMQQSAEDSGILRRAAETPTEFTSRIMSRVSADDSAIRTLLRLYLRTRFGDHPVTADDVVRAREALQGLARSWNDGARAGAMHAGSQPPVTRPTVPPEPRKWAT